VDTTEISNAGGYPGELHSGLDQLAWTSCRLIWPGPGDPPVSLCDRAISSDQLTVGYLTLLRVLTDAHAHVQAGISAAAGSALSSGASAGDIADALGVTRQAVEKRWGLVTQGQRVAVVISRRDRVRQDEAVPHRAYGEVGGAGQYDSDRGGWAAGAAVRAQARYAIVAVDSIVRRVYEIDRWDRWAGKWRFTAVGGRELTASQIDAAYRAGDLPLRPGDECPTRRGGAYRPYWF
jgi:hypothetical protein